MAEGFLYSITTKIHGTENIIQENNKESACDIDIMHKFGCLNCQKETDRIEKGEI